MSPLWVGVQGLGTHRKAAFFAFVSLKIVHSVCLATAKTFPKTFALNDCFFFFDAVGWNICGILETVLDVVGSKLNGLSFEERLGAFVSKSMQKYVGLLG